VSKIAQNIVGRLIVFEGGEGAGKTTQLQLLGQWLERSGWQARLQAQLPHLPQPVLVTREPGGTPLGQQIRQLLLDPTAAAIADRAELLLYAADRAQHVEMKLKPHLAAGGVVLCDRFIASTIAYQGYGRGLDLDLIAQLNQIATAGVTVDLTLWLDLDVKLGLSRARQRHPAGGGLDRMELVDITFHQQVRQGFQALAQVAEQAAEPMVRFDANQPSDALAHQIQAHLAPLLQQWYP
jgi:dTMP kinase